MIDTLPFQKGAAEKGIYTNESDKHPDDHMSQEDPRTLLLDFKLPLGESYRSPIGMKW
jgi:hypothetical protein